jgi:hypothetical protein
MSDELTDEDLSRILTAVETIETSLGILVEKRTLDRYRQFLIAVRNHLDSIHALDS